MSAPFATGDSPEPVAVGDFNNDGHQDIVAGNFFPAASNLTVRLGDGTGGFATEAPGSPDPAGGQPDTIVVGDFNNDGNEDLAVANAFAGGNMTVRLGDGTGAFPTQPPSSPHGAGGSTSSVAIADFNNDGNEDAVFAGFDANQVYVRIGNGSGGFPFAPIGGINVSRPTAIATGDFNGDHNDDFAVTSSTSDNVLVELGAGDGSFTEPTGSPFPAGDSPYGLAVGDFNGDANDDLAISGSASSTEGLMIRLGNGAGGFGTEAAGSPYAGGGTPSQVAVGDVNADANEDLVVAGSTGVSVRLGDGSGGFSTQPAGSPYAGGYAAAVGDFDEDGNQDLAVSNPTTDTITVRRGAGISPEAGNLLVNGNAEMNAAGAARGPAAEPDVPGWFNFGGAATYVRYSSFGGFPSRLSAARWGGGEDFFTDGPHGATGDGLRQAVDVSSSAPLIDAGEAHIRFSADLGGYRDDNDRMEVSLVFSDGSSAFLGAPVVLAPVTAADRHNRTTLLHRSATAVVPAGTRQLGVILSAVHESSSYTHAYADNVRLFLDNDVTPPKTEITRHPDNKIDGHKAKYAFTSSEASSTFKCAFDAKHFKPCSSPTTYKHLDFGKHRFQVVATDAAGNTDPSPAKDKFKRENG